MKKVIVKILVFIVGLIVLDCLIGYIGKRVCLKLAENPRDGQAALLNYNLNGASPDILILGSSEATSAYMPSIIKDSLLCRTGIEYSVFNAGAYNQDIAYNYCTFRAASSRKIPKCIILDVIPSSLCSTSPETSTSQLRPYRSFNPYVRDMLKYNDSKKDQIMSFSNLYCYNSEILKLLMSFRIPIGADGFDAHEGHMDPNQEIVVQENSDSINPIALYEFEHTISEAIDNGSKICVTITPKYRKMDKNSNSYKKIVEICSKYNVPFWDFSDDPLFMDYRIYYNPAHVNPDGALICSKYLASKIVEII